MFVTTVHFIIHSVLYKERRIYSLTFFCSSSSHPGTQYADAGEWLRAGWGAGTPGTGRGRATARGVPLRWRSAIRRTAPARRCRCRLRPLRRCLPRAMPGQPGYIVRRRAQSPARDRRSVRLRLARCRTRRRLPTTDDSWRSLWVTCVWNLSMNVHWVNRQMLINLSFERLGLVLLIIFPLCKSCLISILN